MWPETPCKICGTMTIDEGGLCSSDCVTKWEALPAYSGDPGDEHPEPYFTDACNTNDDMIGRSLPYTTNSIKGPSTTFLTLDEFMHFRNGGSDPLEVAIQTEKDIALFDRVVPEYLSMMEAYHSFEDDPSCHACQLRREVKAYLCRK